MIVVDVVACSSCRSLDGRPVRRFELFVILPTPSPNLARRLAARPILCEQCFRQLAPRKAA